MAFGDQKQVGFNNPFLPGFQLRFTNSGMFLYSAAPALGNLVASYAPSAGTDKYGNAYLAGLVIYGSGNSKVVIGWSTFVGSIPLIAPFPDASWAYAGNSPFIQSFDTNKGLASEYTALQQGSGNPPGGKGSGIIQYSASPDGTTSIPHISFYGGASGNLIADMQAAGLIAANPNIANTAEPWHGMAGSYTNGWSDQGGGNNPGRYRLLVSPPNTVEIEGSLSHASISGSSAFFTLPPNYRPIYAQLACQWTSTITGAVSVSTGGVLTAFNLSATTGIQFHGFISLD